MDKEKIKQVVLDALVLLKSISACTETTLDDTIAALAEKILGNSALLDLILDLLPDAVEASKDGVVMGVGPTIEQRSLLDRERIDWQKVLEFLMLLAQLLGPFLKDEA